MATAVVVVLFAGAALAQSACPVVPIITVQVQPEYYQEYIPYNTTIDPFRDGNHLTIYNAPTNVEITGYKSTTIFPNNTATTITVATSTSTSDAASTTTSVAVSTTSAISTSSTSTALPSQICIPSGSVSASTGELFRTFCGYDTNSRNISSFTASDLTGCNDACVQVDGCQSTVFESITSLQSPGTCTLKGALSYGVVSPNKTWSVKLSQAPSGSQCAQNGTVSDDSGHSYTTYCDTFVDSSTIGFSTFPSFQICLSSCGGTTGCTGVVFDQMFTGTYNLDAPGLCYLKSANQTQPELLFKPLAVYATRTG